MTEAVKVLEKRSRLIGKGEVMEKRQQTRCNWNERTVACAHGKRKGRTRDGAVETCRGDLHEEREYDYDRGIGACRNHDGKTHV